MRTIHTKEITGAVRDLCIRANLYLPDDLANLIKQSAVAETAPLPRQIMADLCENLTAADELQIPICQDTGMAVVFIELGQEVHIEGGLLQDAVNMGVAQGYREGRLRCSVVADPLHRENTGDNTPAILHLSLTTGDQLRITVAPKGFGSENMSRLYMLNPSDSRETVIEKIVETAKLAGGNACPPMVLGVGIGGDFEQCALLAKAALCRPVSQPNGDPYYAELEQDALRAVNRLGIGPQGFGGKTTALHLAIETAPTHIAGLPLAVNIGCHVTRHAEICL